MRAPRIPVTLSELPQTLLYSNTLTQHSKILTTAIAPSRLPKIRGEKEPPNKLMKIKGSIRKDVKYEGTSR